MKALPLLCLSMAVILTGCTSSPHSQDMVRRTTAAVTRTAVSNLKGAALGVRDGLKTDPSKEAIDVNNSPKEKIQTLPGVTAAMAQRIVDNRPYKKPGDLVTKKIISKAVYDKVSSRLVAH